MVSVRIREAKEGDCGNILRLIRVKSEDGKTRVPAWVRAAQLEGAGRTAKVGARGRGNRGGARPEVLLWGLP